MNFYDILLARKLNGGGGGGGYQLATKSGDLISYFNGANLPINKCIVDIIAVQSGSGDPSPSNVRPISGFDEYNLTIRANNILDNTSHSWNINASGKIVSGGTYSTYTAQIEQGKHYLFNCEGSDVGTLVYAFYEDNPTIDSISYDEQRVIVTEGLTNFEVTAPISGYICVRTSKNSTTSRIFAEGKIATADFNTTIYGGRANLLTGEGVLTHKIIDMATLQWRTMASTQPLFRSSTVLSDAKLPASASDEPSVICSISKAAKYSRLDNDSNTIGLIYSTSQYAGQNNIYADTGSIDEIQVFTEV